MKKKGNSTSPRSNYSPRLSLSPELSFFSQKTSVNELSNNSDAEKSLLVDTEHYSNDKEDTVYSCPNETKNHGEFYDGYYFFNADDLPEAAFLSPFEDSFSNPSKDKEFLSWLKKNKSAINTEQYTLLADAQRSLRFDNISIAESLAGGSDRFQKKLNLRDLQETLIEQLSLDESSQEKFFSIERLSNIKKAYSQLPEYVFYRSIMEQLKNKYDVFLKGGEYHNGIETRSHGSNLKLNQQEPPLLDVWVKNFGLQIKQIDSHEDPIELIFNSDNLDDAGEYFATFFYNEKTPCEPIVHDEKKITLISGFSLHAFRTNSIEISEIFKKNALNLIDFNFKLPETIALIEDSLSDPCWQNSEKEALNDLLKKINGYPEKMCISPARLFNDWTHLSKIEHTASKEEMLFYSYRMSLICKEIFGEDLLYEKMAAYASKRKQDLALKSEAIKQFVRRDTDPSSALNCLSSVLSILSKQKNASPNLLTAENILERWINEHIRQGDDCTYYDIYDFFSNTSKYFPLMEETFGSDLTHHFQLIKKIKDHTDSHSISEKEKDICRLLMGFLRANKRYIGMHEELFEHYKQAGVNFMDHRDVNNMKENIELFLGDAFANEFMKKISEVVYDSCLDFASCAGNANVANVANDTEIEVKVSELRPLKNNSYPLYGKRSGGYKNELHKDEDESSDEDGNNKNFPDSDNPYTSHRTVLPKSIFSAKRMTDTQKNPTATPSFNFNKSL